MVILNKPLVDLKSLYSILAGQTIVKDSDIFKFEKEFSQTFGLNKAIATSSARAALVLALKALKIGPGDEILVQTLICSTVIDALLLVGVKPVLVDINLSDFNISLKDLKQKISPRTKAVLVAHLYGVPAQIREIVQFAKDRDLLVIEDCAQSLGTKIKKRYLGTFGDLAIFSFGINKQISTASGGILGINNMRLSKAIYKQAKKEKRTKIYDEKNELSSLLIRHVASGRDFYQQGLNVDLENFSIKDLNDLKADSSVQIENWKKNGVIFFKKSFLLNPFIRQAGFKLEKIINMLSIPSRYYHKPIDRLLMNQSKAQYGLRLLSLILKANSRRHKTVDYLKNNLSSKLWQKAKTQNDDYLVPLCLTVLNMTNKSTANVMVEAQKTGFEIGNLNWPRPVHLKRPYSQILDFDKKTLGQSEYIANRLINLPVHEEISKKDCDQLSGILNRFS